MLTTKRKYYTISSSIKSFVAGQYYRISVRLAPRGKKVYSNEALNPPLRDFPLQQSLSDHGPNN